MNALLDLRMDNATFLQWVQGREGRFELERGRVVRQLTGGSRNHAVLVGRIVMALGNRLDLAIWNVCPTDLAVDIADGVRYPDVLVERTGQDGNELATTDPVVLVEVLSPSSVVRDLKTKLREYTALSSLQAYIVASQDEPIVWIWQRNADGSFPSDPDECSGRSADLPIDHLGITIPLAELYRGIGRT
jgi:Uma2 family endonuclease